MTKQTLGSCSVDVYENSNPQHVGWAFSPTKINRELIGLKIFLKSSNFRLSVI